MINPNFCVQYYSYCEYSRKDNSFFRLVSSFVNLAKHDGVSKAEGILEFFFFLQYLVSSFVNLAKHDGVSKAEGILQFFFYSTFEHVIKHDCKTLISQRDFNTKCRSP